VESGSRADSDIFSCGHRMGCISGRESDAAIAVWLAWWEQWSCHRCFFAVFAAPLFLVNEFGVQFLPEATFGNSEVLML